MKIFINLGHGEKSNGIYDPGAVGPTGLQEAKVNEAIGSILVRKLRNVGIDVASYQSGDLNAITARANNWQADYFVSIHTNAFSERTAEGIETWYYSTSTKGQNLARSIQTQLIKVLGRADRGVKATTGLYVIKNTAMPAVLAEIGFISNPVEEALMKTEDWREKAAEALAVGICSYMGAAYPEPVSPPALDPETGPEIPEPEIPEPEIAEPPREPEPEEPEKQEQEPEVDTKLESPDPAPQSDQDLWQILIEIFKRIVNALRKR